MIWGDQDLFGHVNNVVYLRWFESSRVAYWDDSGMRELMEPNNLGPILASIHCDYKQQIRYPDAIEVSARMERLGNTSMTIHHELWSDDVGGIAATGTSVIVLFDYKAQQPQSISKGIRQVIQDFEGNVSL